MANKEITGRVKNRSDTKARWASVNPILALGELGYESDTGKLKVGDGATTWNNLDYYGGGGSAIDDDEIVDILGGVSSEPQESILISEVQNMISQSVAQAVASVKAELNATTTQAVNAAKADILNEAYPVGAIYISVNDVNPSTLFGGTWEKVSAGRVLQGADSSHAVGSTIEAGLPDPDIDIIYRQDSTSSGVYSDLYGKDGYTGSAYSNTNGTDEWMQSSKAKGVNRPLAAICTNSIYGASTTVQPPAFVVNIWKRTK